MLEPETSYSFNQREPNILSPDRLEKLKHVLENVGALIVEHWHFCGGRCQDILVFKDYDELIEYFQKNTRPGDRFYFWDQTALCRDDNFIVTGKIPDQHGFVPKGGAY